MPELDQIKTPDEFRLDDLPQASKTLSHPQMENSFSRAMGDAIAQLFSSDKMEMKSILSMDTIYHLIRLITFAEKHKSPMAAKVANLIMELVVSEKGYGRRDMREVIVSMLSSERAQEPTDNRNIVRRVLGI